MVEAHERAHQTGRHLALRDSRVRADHRAQDLAMLLRMAVLAHDRPLHDGKLVDVCAPLQQ